MKEDRDFDYYHGQIESYQTKLEGLEKTLAQLNQINHQIIDQNQKLQGKCKGYKRRYVDSKCRIKMFEKKLH